MENNKSTVSRLSLKERIGYGLGDFSCNIIYIAMTAYLLFYYTDYAKVSAGAVGIIMLISRIFDGVSDIFMGSIVDNTHTEKGKARPWILRMAFPFAISGILLFSVPQSWSTAMKYVYIFVTYNLTSTVVYTAINVPYSSLNALMTQDPYERSVLAIFRNLLATLGTFVINSFTLSLVEYFGNEASSWTKTFILFGCIAALGFILTYKWTKERVKPVNKNKSENIKLSVGLKALTKNKYWIMMTGILCLLFINMALQFGSSVYFAQSVLGDKNIAQTMNGVMNISQIVFMFVVANFVKRIGKKNSMFIGLILQTIGVLILVFVKNTNIVTYISSIIRGIGGSFSGAVMWAMVSDTVDYGEWKTGFRMEGLTNSASSFGYKVGNGVGTALLGAILNIGGYVGGQAIQSDAAVKSIHTAFWVLPTIITIAILVILVFYKLDKEFGGIINDLNKRREEFK